jgi:hypothetical protein
MFLPGKKAEAPSSVYVTIMQRPDQNKRTGFIPRPAMALRPERVENASLTTAKDAISMNNRLCPCRPNFDEQLFMSAPAQFR